MVQMTPVKVRSTHKYGKILEKGKLFSRQSFLTRCPVNLGTIIDE